MSSSISAPCCASGWSITIAGSDLPGLFRIAGNQEHPQLLALRQRLFHRGEGSGSGDSLRPGVSRARMLRITRDQPDVQMLPLIERHLDISQRFVVLE